MEHIKSAFEQAKLVIIKEIDANGPISEPETMRDILAPWHNELSAVDVQHLLLFADEYS